MVIETKRLQLVALTPDRLKHWLEDIDTLEQELSMVYKAEPLIGEFLDIVKGQLVLTENNPENYFWHSFWLMIRKVDRTVVGSADFKSGPDACGAVEIGYGLGTAFEHQGYMTEAVRAMTGWALRQSGITQVIAETERTNLASQHVLARCGFERCDRVSHTGAEDTLWWRLSLN